VETLKKEIQNACQNRDFRVGIDSLGNQFRENRVIIQFKVKPETYDWFYNARTGYRTQFWISTENGRTYNENLIKNLRDTFLENISQTIPARRIEVNMGDDSRQEKDAGETTLTHKWIRHSLEPNLSKVWICEYLIKPDNSSDEIGLTTLSAAQRKPKLEIPKWKTNNNYGLLAPYPVPQHFWLDIKGAFIRKNGDPYQKKSPEERAKSLFQTGWT
jgi:hypothetical protein